MKKKVSIGVTVAVAMISAAVFFSLAYIISTNVMNAKLTDLSEKQKLFSALSDVDSYVREKYDATVDEAKLSTSLCDAYAGAFDGRVLYISADDYENSQYMPENGYTVLRLSDGSAVVVLTADQAATQ